MDTKFSGAKIHKQVTDWLNDCNYLKQTVISDDLPGLYRAPLNICSHGPKRTDRQIYKDTKTHPATKFVKRRNLNFLIYNTKPYYYSCHILQDNYMTYVNNWSVISPVILCWQYVTSVAIVVASLVTYKVDKVAMTTTHTPPLSPVIG